MDKIPISQVTPDFELLYEALKKRLQGSNAWVDLLPTNVGSTILDMFAATGTPSQFAIEMALREGFLESARRDSSIFSGTRGLGVHISRKVPAGAPAILELEDEVLDTVIIPPYSEFIVGDDKFFNRDQAIVAPGAPTEIGIYEGVVGEKVFDLDAYINLDFREFRIGIENFRVADTDIFVFTRNKVSGAAEYWTRSENALFEHKATDAVYYEMTTGKGDVAFVFGDGKFGKRLPANSELVIKFVVTTGSTGNNGMSGLTGSYMENPDVVIQTKSAMRGGADEKSAQYYKLFAPNMFRSRKRVVSHPDYISTISGYPGVADVAVLAQKDIAPDDPRWMNMIRICVLPETETTWGGSNPNPKSSAWTAFLDWFRGKYGIRDIQTWNPEKIHTDVRVQVAIEPGRDKEAIRIKIMERILKLFMKKPGILGRKLARSDLEDACRVDGVDYIEVIVPEKTIVPETKMQYIVLRDQPQIDIVYTERTKVGV